MRVLSTCLPASTPADSVNHFPADLGIPKDSVRSDAALGNGLDPKSVDGRPSYAILVAISVIGPLALNSVFTKHSRVLLFFTQN